MCLIVFEMKKKKEKKIRKENYEIKKKDMLTETILLLTLTYVNIFE